VTHKPRRALALLVGFLTIVAISGCAQFRAAMLYQRGTEELNRGQVERALVDLSAAAELAPNASEIHNHLGLAFATAGQHERALAEFERAVDLDCSNAAAVGNLAVAEKRDDRRRAMAILSNAEDLQDE